MKISNRVVNTQLWTVCFRTGRASPFPPTEYCTPFAGARGGLPRKWALEQRDLERELSHDELRAISESVEKQVSSSGPVAIRRS